MRSNKALSVGEEKEGWLTGHCRHLPSLTFIRFLWLSPGTPLLIALPLPTAAPHSLAQSEELGLVLLGQGLSRKIPSALPSREAPVNRIQSSINYLPGDR